MSAADLQRRPALAPHVRRQRDDVSGSEVLLHPEGIFELNATGGEILGRCDGRASVAEIIAALMAEYDAAEELMRAEVLQFLHQLLVLKLIVLEP